MINNILKIKCLLCENKFETLKTHKHNRISCPSCGNNNEEKLKILDEHNTKVNKRSKR